MDVQEDEKHPTVSKEDRFIEDRLLRRWGYRIHARPAHGEPTWIHVSGVFHTHSEALMRIAEFERDGIPAEAKRRRR